MTRSGDVHLSDEELQNLLESDQIGTKTLATEPIEQIADARRHLESCPHCRAKLQEYLTVERQLRRLRPLTNASPGLTCPPENKLMLLAAGLHSSGEAEELLQHAIVCDHCGPLLRLILEEFDPQTNPDEDRSLSALSSHDEPWQKALAARLRTRDQQPERLPAKTTSSKTSKM